MSTDFVDNSDNILEILKYTEGDYPSGMGEGLSSSENKIYAGTCRLY